MNFIEPLFDHDLLLTDPDFDWEGTFSQMLNFLSSTPLEDKIRISQAWARVDGVEVTDYEAMVVSRFYLGGDLCLGLADGNTFNIGEMARELRALLVRLGLMNR